MSRCLIWKIFVADQKEKLFKRLENFFTNLETKMTQEKYYEMMSQLNKEPVESEVPVGWEDLGEEAQDAINIYSLLGSRAAPELGYLGKDYTMLSQLIKIYDVQNLDLLIQMLHWLDTRSLNKNAEMIKAMHNKAKSGSKAKS